MNLVIDADRRFHNRTIALLRLSRNETQRSHPTGDSAPKAALITRFRGFTSDGMDVAIIEWDL